MRRLCRGFVGPLLSFVLGISGILLFGNIQNSHENTAINIVDHFQKDVSAIETYREDSSATGDELLVPCVDRTKRVQEVCERRGSTGLNDSAFTEITNRIIVDKRHKVLYCIVPKAACSTFKTILLEATGLTNVSKEGLHRIKPLVQAGLTTLESAGGLRALERGNFKSYKRFLAVRHPLDRLVSAYNDKFSTGLGPFPLKRKDVIADVFPTGVAVSESGQPKLTLHQFLELVSKEYHDRFRDYHWLSFEDTCDPCRMKYDKVIKLETLSSDIDTVLNWLDYNRTTSRLNSKRSNARENFAEVTKLFRGLLPSVFERLMELYGRDMEMFGYSWDDQKGVQCSNVNTDGSACC